MDLHHRRIKGGQRGRNTGVIGRAQANAADVVGTGQKFGNIATQQICLPLNFHAHIPVEIGFQPKAGRKKNF